jgi:putative acyl-CoA dehydrogenase
MAETFPGMTVPDLSATHDVTNQVAPLIGYNAYTQDQVLCEALAATPGAWVAQQARELGALAGDERVQALARDANRHVPELRTHDAQGRRIDFIEYHPAYHELMSLACTRGVHSLAWSAKRAGAFSARAALFYLWSQIEQGTACPLTMTFAGIPLLHNAPGIAAEWEPKILAHAYDARALPVSEKSGATVGMAMTEKQGGSDLRTVQTRAVAAGEDWFALTGHKWFCSAPMSDGFFTLALLEKGVTCFFVPRSLPDGSRNRFFIQRLKDKVGNCSNASAEIEYRDTLARQAGEAGRGIATIIEMTHYTRFDIVVATAGMMRAMLTQALHHAQQRSAFGKRLFEQTLMRNVLADLALESEAATLLAFRLTAAFDAAGNNESERHLARILTPIAKYWHCKRITPFAVEAMECLGGNGYVEESPMGRLYREAPVNGIWEGSGNVICLDVLRSIGKTPEALEVLLRELDDTRDARIARHVARVRAWLARGEELESNARRLVEAIALAVQARLLEQRAPAEIADAFIAARLGGEGGHVFGTLAPSANFDAILSRSCIGIA